MPAPLYARYVPPKPKLTSDGTNLHATPHPDSSKKRKHIGIDAAASKKRKQGPEHRSETVAEKRDSAVNDGGRADVEGKKAKTSKRTDQDTETLNGSEAENRQEQRGDNDSEEPELRNIHHESRTKTSNGILAESSYDAAPTRKKRKRKEEAEALPNGVKEVSDEQDDRKHAGLFSKYEKAIKSQGPPRAPPPDVQDTQEKEGKSDRGLVPIPVPKRERHGPAFDAHAALPSWLSNYTAIKDDDGCPFDDLNIDPQHLKQLRRLGFERALPVQGRVLPLLLPLKTQHPGDVCVSAVTGSGKTIAYALPIVQSLVKQGGTGLRTVVVVPTRELVNQACEVFEMFTRGTSLKIGTATGAQHLEGEQAALVDHKLCPEIEPLASATQEAVKDELSQHADDDGEGVEEGEDLLELYRPRPHVPPGHTLQYMSRVDILIATPGRLVDHIKETRGFGLQDLQWLIIDEADRLLDASFQEWVSTVNDAIAIPRHAPPPFLDHGPRHPVKKVLLSATMTRDLDKLSALKLWNPMLVSSADTEQLDESLSLPPNLTEYGVPVGDGSDKPLHLLKLLDDVFEGRQPGSAKIATRSQQDDIAKDAADAESDDDDSSVLSESSASSITSSNSASPPPEFTKATPANALIFTSSTESANRLSNLLRHLRPDYDNILATLTKSATSKSTVKAISRFQAGNHRILIATDRVARGLDLPNLINVINYDIPHSVTSYVHRVGRTARAGKPGNAWTLLEDKQARWFWKQEIATGAKIHGRMKPVEKIRLAVGGLGENVRTDYAKALQSLHEDVKGTRKE